MGFSDTSLAIKKFMSAKNKGWNTDADFDIITTKE